uniref:RPA43 OB domain-containing protein n=1 Tax=Timema douglasi TaxID=61478 RepID=A0A7R8Z8U4_TIMDO|nr:unnamed protein product [Timema douglasi]
MWENSRSGPELELARYENSLFYPDLGISGTDMGMSSLDLGISGPDVDQFWPDMIFPHGEDETLNELSINPRKINIRLKLKGILLGYENVKTQTSSGLILYDDSLIHIDIVADFYVFTPEVGCHLNGIVNKKSSTHIGCLVYKVFNVSIPNEDWVGQTVEIGQQVTFQVTVLDMTGRLPYIRGKLIRSCNEDGKRENTKENYGDEVYRENIAREAKKDEGRLRSITCATQKVKKNLLPKEKVTLTYLR